jgi:hypothetical protein
VVDFWPAISDGLKTGESGYSAPETDRYALSGMEGQSGQRPGGIGSSPTPHATDEGSEGRHRRIISLASAGGEVSQASPATRALPWMSLARDFLYSRLDVVAMPAGRSRKPGIYRGGA